MSSVRVPQMTRERTSVDWTVVPIRWSRDGASSCAKRVPFDRNWSKSYGDTTGAKTASRMNAEVIAMPAHSMTRAVPRASPIGPSARRAPAATATGSAAGGVSATPISSGSSGRCTR